MSTPAYKLDQSPNSSFTQAEIIPHSRLDVDFESIERRSSWRRWQGITLSVVDGLAFLIAYLTASFFVQPDGIANTILFSELVHTERLAIYSVVLGAGLMRFYTLGHYTNRKTFWDQLGQITSLVCILAMAEATLLFLAKVEFSRQVFLTHWIMVLILLPVFRSVLITSLIRLGSWRWPTIIIGCGQNAIEAATTLGKEKFLGYQVVGFLAMPAEEIPDDGYIAINGTKVPVVRLTTDPVSTVRSLGMPHVVVALENGELALYQEIIKQLYRGLKRLTVVPTLRGLPLCGLEANHFFNHEIVMLSVQSKLARASNRILKRTFDILASASLLLLLSPLLAYIGLQVRKTGKQVIFGHDRVGQRHRLFKCYKFRSMVPNADQVLEDLLKSDPQARAEWDQVFKLKDDPRITSIGHIIRKTSLDELPQLWNVLKGDMSLVGPRPIVQQEIERYKQDIDYYLGVKPGITGLWQVSGRNDTGYDERVQMDSWYVRNWSLWHDVVILLQTVKVVFTRHGAY